MPPRQSVFVCDQSSLDDIDPVPDDDASPGSDVDDIDPVPADDASPGSDVDDIDPVPGDDASPGSGVDDGALAESCSRLLDMAKGLLDSSFDIRASLFHEVEDVEPWHDLEEWRGLLGSVSRFA